MIKSISHLGMLIVGISIFIVASMIVLVHHQHLISGIEQLSVNVTMTNKASTTSSAEGALIFTHGILLNEAVEQENLFDRQSVFNQLTQIPSDQSTDCNLVYKDQVYLVRGSGNMDDFNKSFKSIILSKNDQGLLVWELRDEVVNGQ